MKVAIMLSDRLIAFAFIIFVVLGAALPLLYFPSSWMIGDEQSLRHEILTIKNQVQQLQKIVDQIHTCKDDLDIPQNTTQDVPNYNQGKRLETTSYTTGSVLRTTNLSVSRGPTSNPNESTPKSNKSQKSNMPFFLLQSSNIETLQQICDLSPTQTQAIRSILQLTTADPSMSNDLFIREQIESILTPQQRMKYWEYLQNEHLRF